MGMMRRDEQVFRRSDQLKKSEKVAEIVFCLEWRGSDDLGLGVSGSGLKEIQLFQ